MPNVKDMTPEEAYRRLAEMQEKARDRQRGHYQQSKEQGRAKVSVFLSEEASRILERERGEGRTISDILSAALVEWDQRSRVPEVKPKPRITPPPLPKPSPLPDGGQVEQKPYDEVKTVGRIVELHKQGLSDPQIAKQLENEGWLTAQGNQQWQRVVVGRKRREALG